MSWEEACERVRADDLLPVREVGEWSEDKLLFWHKYVQQTTMAMVGNPAWKGGLAYVDLFSGPGICRIRESGRCIPGSPLIAAFAKKPFAKIVVVEFDETLASACEQRLGKVLAKDRFAVLRGDCNGKVGDVVAQIPAGALTLAFIDPEGLDAKFETVASLSRAGRVDLLILFPDAVDVVRNVDQYAKQDHSKLDEVLGPQSDWRSKWTKLENRSGANVREFFEDIYIDQLRQRLGYRKFGTRVVRTPRGPLYRLVYASKHERGLDFWQKVVAKDKSGQSNLPGL